MLRHDFSAWAIARDVEEAAFLRKEKALVASRRVALKLDGEAPGIGLALSGGGIRSATFSLGLLRELAAQKLLHRFDYLSTVSGGSYIGAYYASLFAPREVDGVQLPPVLNRDSFAGNTDPFRSADGLPQASLEWLRQSGRYLAPQGAGDYWKAIGLLVRNWLGLQLVIGSTVMLLALLAAGFRLVISHLVFAPHETIIPHWLCRAPLLVLLVIPLSVHVAVAWAYWLTRRDLHGRTGWSPNVAQIGSVIILAGAAAIASSDGLAQQFTVEPAGATEVRVVAAVIAAAALLGLAALALSGIYAGRAVSAEERWDHRRAWLTQPMSFCAAWTAAILVAAASDAFAFFLYGTIWAGRSVAVSAAASTALVPAGRWLVSRLMQIAGSVPRSRTPDDADKPVKASRLVNADVLTKLAAMAATALLIVAVITFWSVLAYKAVSPMSGNRAWDGIPPVSDFTATIRTWFALALALGFLSACIAKTTTFLNLSSLTSFYAGRLRRAYLGAGNPDRLNRGTAVALDAWAERDDVSLGNYYPAAAPIPAPGATPNEAVEAARSAAPLHLINITLNETRGFGSNIVQRDRRGRNLTLSPGGLYCNGDSRDRLFRIEYGGAGHEHLPLSAWVAISGAAFSTGLGARTGFPMSQLAGLANVRLGYWWRAASSKIASPTQWDLLREFRGDFSGPYKKYWYLSDGGHFENTGAYELIRRKLPLIVISDNGMDERFEYEDLANLVRKARIDFGCDIDFLAEDDLDLALKDNATLRRSFGTLRDIAGGGDPENVSAIAALARLRYDVGSANETTGTLLLIKPRLTGVGPVDLIRYKEINASFPQQTTLDQFFDEAQWESYYHLGRLMAQALFDCPAPAGAPKQGGWVPAMLRPLP